MLYFVRNKLHTLTHTRVLHLYRERDIKTVKSAESDGQKTSRTRKEGRRQRQKTRSDAPSIGGQKQEERTNREAAEAQDHPALPSVVSMNWHRSQAGYTCIYLKQCKNWETMQGVQLLFCLSEKEDVKGRRARRRGQAEGRVCWGEEEEEERKAETQRVSCW